MRKQFAMLVCLALIVAAAFGLGGASGAQASAMTGLLDVTKALGGSASKDGLAEKMKVVDTADGTYMCYMTKSNLFKAESGETAINEFTMLLIGSDHTSVTQLGYFYTRAGDIDLVAAPNGKIYAVGGSSDHVIESLDTNTFDASKENCFIQVFEYDKNVGPVINELSMKKPVAEAKGYAYLTTCLTQDGKIVSFFNAAESVYWFVFDTSTGEWTQEGGSADLSAAPVKALAFGASAGPVLVYATDSEVDQLDCATGTSTTLQSGITELKDAYLDASGAVSLAYVAGGKMTVSAGGAAAELSGAAAEDYARFCTNASGTVYVMVMKSGSADVTLFTADGKSAGNVTLDASVSPLAAPSVATSRGGAQADGVVDLAIPVKVKVSTHWFYGQVQLP